MNILILGAGELGKQLTWTLCDNRKHKVTVVDYSANRLERLRERLGVMTVSGEAASVGVLKSAGVDKAELLLAVTGSDASNVLACRIARHFGVERTICRVSKDHFFSDSDGFSPREMSIDHLIHPLNDCVDQITRVIRHHCAIERFALSRANCEICAFHVRPDSAIADIRLSDFPEKELLRRVRFSLVIRNRRLVVPSGDFVFKSGDEVYAAGVAGDLETLLDYVDTKTKNNSMIIVAGASPAAHQLVQRLKAAGENVRVVASDADLAREMMDEVGDGVMFIQGDANEAEVLEDAGIDKCRIFIGALADDENNILGCVLAKNMGASKVIAVTNKAEYVDIVPAMNPIDCGFSPRLVAVNSVLNLLSSDTVRVHALLQRVQAYVYEFKVEDRAPVCGKKIVDAFPRSTIISLVFRGGEAMPATGDMVLKAGDIAVVIARPRDASRIETLLRRKRIMSL